MLLTYWNDQQTFTQLTSAEEDYVYVCYLCHFDQIYGKGPTI